MRTPLLLWCLVLQTSPVHNQPELKEIREGLLSSYSKFFLPPQRPLTVNCTLLLCQLIDLNVATESVHAVFWQWNMWKDERLARDVNVSGQGYVLFDKTSNILKQLRTLKSWKTGTDI